MPLTIRKATKADHDGIVAVWRRSVEATHHFLSKADIDNLEPLIPGYLTVVPVLVAIVDEAVVGFIGISHSYITTKVEMLFVDPDHFGKGLGSTLLEAVMPAGGDIVIEVDVNEENPDALGFYQHQGFRIVGRSETDEQGNPFPILHLKRLNRKPEE